MFAPVTTDHEIKTSYRLLLFPYLDLQDRRFKGPQTLIKGLRRINMPFQFSNRPWSGRKHALQTKSRRWFVVQQQGLTQTG